jgi:hypothetical protein
MQILSSTLDDLFSILRLISGDTLILDPVEANRARVICISQERGDAMVVDISGVFDAEDKPISFRHSGIKKFVQSLAKSEEIKISSKDSSVVVFSTKNATRSIRSLVFEPEILEIQKMLEQFPIRAAFTISRKELALSLEAAIETETTNFVMRFDPSVSRRQLRIESGSLSQTYTGSVDIEPDPDAREIRSMFTRDCLSVIRGIPVDTLKISLSEEHIEIRAQYKGQTIRYFDRALTNEQ